MFTAVLLMTGCQKISANKLEGLWSSEPRWNSRYEHNQRLNVYYFINSNTVVEYVNVTDRMYPEDEPFLPTIETPISGHSGWYRSGYMDRTWTYVFEDNKVILSSGTIFTYMDGKLYKDGSSAVLERW